MAQHALAADAAVDLQLHTVYSDGQWLPEQLLDYLVREGFGAAAITDHDRVDIVEPLQQLARDAGFPLLIAVEMSAHWGDGLVDVLCYGFEPAASPLRALADGVLARQQANIWQTVGALEVAGHTLTAADLQAVAALPSVRQPHALVDLAQQHGIGDADRSAGRVLLDAGLEIVTTDIAQVVDAVHRSGGVCLIAHPGRGGGFVVFDDALLDRLREEVAIDGLEAHYPAHTPAQVAQFAGYAGQHGLLTSAGSDSHHRDRPPVRYPAAACRALLERLGYSVV